MADKVIKVKRWTGSVWDELHPLTTMPQVEGLSTALTNMQGDIDDKVDDADVSEAATGSKIVKRNSSGDVNVRYVNATAGATAGAATNYWVETGSDSYMRKKTLANVKTEIVTQAAVEAAVGVAPGAILDLSSQLQLGAEYDSVIALCLAGTAGSNSAGKITLSKTASEDALSIEINYKIIKSDGVTGAHYHALAIGDEGVLNQDQWVKFQYNSVWYAGIQIEHNVNDRWEKITWQGDGNFTPFGKDYFNDDTNVDLNTEIANSITAVDMTPQDRFELNGSRIFTYDNHNPYPDLVLDIDIDTDTASVTFGEFYAYKGRAYRFEFIFKTDGDPQVGFQFENHTGSGDYMWNYMVLNNTSYSDDYDYSDSFMQLTGNCYYTAGYGPSIMTGEIHYIDDGDDAGLISVKAHTSNFTGVKIIQYIATGRSKDIDMGTSCGDITFVAVSGTILAGAEFKMWRVK